MRIPFCGPMVSNVGTVDDTRLFKVSLGSMCIDLINAFRLLDLRYMLAPVL